MEIIKTVTDDGSVIFSRSDAAELDEIGRKLSENSQALELTEEQVQQTVNNQKIFEAKQYLISTDWYVARLAETGKPVPAEVSEKRTECRTLISTLQGSE